MRLLAHCAKLRDMSHLVTAREAARIAHRSHSQINRDAASGKLPVAYKAPGTRGQRLFTIADLADVYEDDVDVGEAVAS